MRVTIVDLAQETGGDDVLTNIPRDTGNKYNAVCRLSDLLPYSTMDALLPATCADQASGRDLDTYRGRCVFHYVSSHAGHHGIRAV